MGELEPIVKRTAYDELIAMSGDGLNAKQKAERVENAESISAQRARLEELQTCITAAKAWQKCSLLQRKEVCGEDDNSNVPADELATGLVALDLDVALFLSDKDICKSKANDTAPRRAVTLTPMKMLEI